MCYNNEPTEKNNNNKWQICCFLLTCWRSCWIRAGTITLILCKTSRQARNNGFQIRSNIQCSSSLYALKISCFFCFDCLGIKIFSAYMIVWWICRTTVGYQLATQIMFWSGSVDYLSKITRMHLIMQMYQRGQLHPRSEGAWQLHEKTSLQTKSRELICC